MVLEPTGSPARLEAVPRLRALNTTGQRTLPEALPTACLPQHLRPFGGTHGTRNRRAYACAVLTSLRDAIKRGNGWVPGRQRLGQLDDCFLPEAAWALRRQAVCHPAGVPPDPPAATASLTERLNVASARFLAALPAHTSVTVDTAGWPLSSDPAEPVSADGEAGMTGLRTWLRDKVPTIRLPERLIAVDND